MFVAASRHICSAVRAHEREEHGGELELRRQLLGSRAAAAASTSPGSGTSSIVQAREILGPLVEVGLTDGQLRRAGLEHDGVARRRVGHLDPPGR